MSVSSRSQVGCILLLLLSISALQKTAMEARHLQERAVEGEEEKKTQPWEKSAFKATNEGFYESFKRVVPSSPNPLHNRRL
ncbi:hypothetical protein NMG60_11020731 [Bertholletia excelsa]